MSIERRTAPGLAEGDAYVPEVSLDTDAHRPALGGELEVYQIRGRARVILADPKHPWVETEVTLHLTDDEALAIVALQAGLVARARAELEGPTRLFDHAVRRVHLGGR